MEKIANYIVALTTPIFIDRTTFGGYYFFACSAFLCTIVCALFMFETKGHSLELIEQQYLDGTATTTGRWAMEKIKMRPIARTCKVQDVSKPGSHTSGDVSRCEGGLVA